ncbi:MAG: hypothetical protein J6P53_00165, partial [Mailhella sp.]|nr:hypothetical protein [Mailhella sp.]
MPRNLPNDVRTASTSPDVRDEALGLLLRIASGKDDAVPLPALLSQLSSCKGLSSIQEAFLSELTYGVLRLSSLLDLCAGSYIARPGKLSSMMRMLLRIAIFEMLFVERIPSRATVDECVSIAKRRFGQRAAGFFNAVLRRIAREASRLADGIHERISHLSASSTSEDIALCGSIPPWLAEHWSSHYGQAVAASIVRGLIHAPRPCWRVNTARSCWNELMAECLSLGCERCAPHGFFAPFAGTMPADMQDTLWERLHALEASGAVSRQGKPSQVVAADVAGRMIRFRGGHAGLWDCCCGRGGKTAALMEQGVRVILASDPSSFRLEELQKQFCRLDIPCPSVLRNAAQEITGRSFDAVFVDAPCSGTGTVARNPELIFRLSPEMIKAVSTVQK